MIFGRGNHRDGRVAGPGYASPSPGEGAPVASAADAEVRPAGGQPSTVEATERLAELARLQQERAALIDLCLYARDRVNSPAAADRIEAGLAELGITSLRPDGEPFDPARHEAATGVPTTDVTLHGTVAETEVPGYADRGRVVRPPVVAVYRRGEA